MRGGYVLVSLRSGHAIARLEIVQIVGSAILFLIVLMRHDGAAQACLLPRRNTPSPLLH
jgi:hypothetical protein